MDLREFLGVLRKSWLVLTVVTVLGGLGGLWAAHASPAVYQSRTQLYFNGVGAHKSLTTEYSSGVTVAQRVATYVELVSSPLVSTAVAGRLGDPSLAGEIQGELSATQPTSTYLIDVTVKDHSPQRAQRIARAFGKVFTRVVDRVESGKSGGRAPFTFTVVQPATYNSTPVSPNKRLDVALGLVLGLVVAVLLSLGRHVLDRSITTADALTDDFALPVLATIPFDRGAHRRPLLAGHKGQARAEAFRQLRTTLQFTGRGRWKRVLVVTSATTGEGKTTTAANLALTLARAGAGVVLVDADLRRPRLDRLFGLPSARGLTSVLLGQMDVSDALQPATGTGAGRRLAVLCSGPAVANPSELLGSTAMTRLLEELTHVCDFVVLDAAPLLPVADATVLGAMADDVILVVRHGRTKREQLRRAVASLRQVDAPVLGAVFSMVPPSDGAAADYYYPYPSQRAGVAADRPFDLRPADGKPSRHGTIGSVPGAGAEPGPGRHGLPASSDS